MKATYNQLLQQAEQVPPCLCDLCQCMCLTPCWGTPTEIRKLIDVGYGHRLMLERWRVRKYIWLLTPALKGYGGKQSPDDITWTMDGCAFLNRFKRCVLHNKGLKPIEGRLSHHDPELGHKYGIQLRNWIAKQWDTAEGIELVDAWRTMFTA